MHLLLLLELGRGDLSVGLEDGDDEGDAEVGEGDGEEPGQGRLPNPRAGDGLRDSAGELHQVQGLVLNPWKVLLHLFFFFLLSLLGRGRGLLGGWPGLVAGGLGAERGEGGGAPVGEEEERCRRKRTREGEGGGGAGMRAMEGEESETRRHGHGQALSRRPLLLTTKISF